MICWASTNGVTLAVAKVTPFDTQTGYNKYQLFF